MSQRTTKNIQVLVSRKNIGLLLKFNNVAFGFKIGKV